MAVHFAFVSTSNDWHSIPVAEKSIPLWKLKDEIYLFCEQGCKKKLPMKQDIGFKVFYAGSKEEIVGAQTAIASYSYVIVKRMPMSALLEEERLAAAALSCSKAREVEEQRKASEAEVDDGFGDDIYSTSSCQSASSGGSVATSSLTAISAATKPPKVVAPVRSAVGPTVAQGRRVEKVVKDVNVEQESVIKSSPEVKVPPELTCSVCREMMNDPVLIPCCFYSFCRKCVVTAILEQHKCPQCGSSKCKDSDLLPNRNTNDRIVAFMKSRAIACDVATVSSKGSCSNSQSLAPKSEPSEAGRGTSESKKAVMNRPPVVLHLAPEKAPCTQVVGVKRKAPQHMTHIRAYNRTELCGQ